jgi:hypothetical protein
VGVSYLLGFLVQGRRVGGSRKYPQGGSMVIVDGEDDVVGGHRCWIATADSLRVLELVLSLLQS